MATKTTTDLRKPQVRVLEALAKAKEPLTRSVIADKAKVDQAGLTEYIGSTDKTKRAANDKRKGWKSLISLGYVKAEDSEGATAYSITAAGRKAV